MGPHGTATRITWYNMLMTFPALLSVAILCGLSVFQASLALGAPFGHFAWGGKHKVLPKNLRIGSLVSILVYLFMSIVLLSKSGCMN